MPNLKEEYPFLPFIEEEDLDPVDSFTLGLWTSRMMSNEEFLVDMIDVHLEKYAKQIAQDPRINRMLLNESTVTPNKCKMMWFGPKKPKVSQ